MANARACRPASHARSSPGACCYRTAVKSHTSSAQHWSTRTSLDKNRSLWGGYVLSLDKQRFYFAGDSGFCSVFGDIGRRFGPIALAAIPIGAYEPRWFMRPQHTNPADAVQVHRDVQSQASIGIHWGTFCLTDEPMDEPPILLREEVCAGVVSETLLQSSHRWPSWRGRRRLWPSISAPLSQPWVWLHRCTLACVVYLLYTGGTLQHSKEALWQPPTATRS